MVAEGEVTEYKYCAALSNAFSERLGFRIDIPALRIRRNDLKPRCGVLSSAWAFQRC